ncbi:MAG: glycosyltransferase [Halobacteriovoraceae bacterium]|nr:glycosyltransferase [Halobacteriovoraceae bacterium]
MTNKPFFSVIIPTHNRASTLPRAVESVLGQTDQDFELIIVDDGSSDSTHKYLEQLPATIKMIKNSENKGVSFSRNRGVEQSYAPWLCFLDSDDEWLPHKLKRQKEFILQHPEFSILHGEERWVRNGVRVNPMKKHQKSGGDLFEASLHLCLISPSTVCLSRKLFEEMGGFREDFPVCEDYDLWLKITSAYQVGFIPDELIIKYGGHCDQLSRKYKAMDYYRVKSMQWIYENRKTLSDLQRSQLIDVLTQKAEILINGYKKHQNYSNLEEVRLISQQFQEIISVGV